MPLKFGATGFAKIDLHKLKLTSMYLSRVGRTNSEPERATERRTKNGKYTNYKLLSTTRYNI